MVDFKSDFWPEQLFRDDMRKLLDEVTANGTSKSDVELLLDFVTNVNGYFDCGSINYDFGEYQTEIIDNMHRIELIMTKRLEEKQPLKTAKEEKLYAAIIDLLVFYGAPKTKVIPVFAEWLGISEDKVKKLLPKFSKIRGRQGSLIKDAPGVETGHLLMCGNNIQELISRGRDFPEHDKEVYSAYCEMLKGIEYWQKIISIPTR